jgi:hypothetical protein
LRIILRAEPLSPFSSPSDRADVQVVDQTVTHLPKGPYREVLDWLVDQIERLDAHSEQLAAEAERGEVDQETINARRAAISHAHAWLADQLRQALVARGMRDAA